MRVTKEDVTRIFTNVTMKEKKKANGSAVSHVKRDMVYMSKKMQKVPL